MSVNEIKKFVFLHKPNEYLCHIYFVYKIALDLQREYGGNKKVIIAAALLHDIGRDDSRQPHEVAGTKLARNVLPGFSYNQKQIDQVCDCILVHNAKQRRPKTLEEKIVTSADGAAKVLYAPIFSLLSTKPPAQKPAWILKHIDSGYSKIYLPKFKRSIKSRYQQMRNFYQLILRELSRMQ